MRNQLLSSFVFLICLLATVVGTHIILVSGKCQRDQQSLLLQIKESLRFNSSLSVNLLQWSKRTDCCDWNGVVCNKAGRVIALDLSYESLSGGIENAAGLFGLQFLESLNLAFNLFNKTQVPSGLANLTDLIYLNLSHSGFTGHIPNVSGMKKLVTLDLSLNFFTGPIDSSLADLRFLSVIHLEFNNLSSPFPEFFADFMNLTDLELSYCELYGIVPENIFQIPTLKNLGLSGNKLLHGSLPDFSQNMSLEILTLGYSNFSGILPDSIGSLKYLSRIMLQGCNFTGPIPPSVSNLTRLSFMDLSFNNFNGEISSFGWEQLPNLYDLDLSNNALNGSIPTSLFQHPSLITLDLADNQFEGQLSEFSNVSSSVLEEICLFGNRLEGSIPMSIFELKHLSRLQLDSNNFNGTVELNKIPRSSKLAELWLSHNNLTVNASALGSSLPQLRGLGLAGCKLSMIPDLMNQSNLEFLDLSENQISGEIPNWLWEIFNGTLPLLNLSHNFLEGLQEPYSVSSLRVLDLHSNQLQGKLPQFPPSAVYVDFSSNNFSSSIPDEIGDFLIVTRFLSLSNNSLAGVIPESLCSATLLQVLELSSNNLVGALPTCLFKWSNTLGVLNLRGNNLTGTISDAFTENCGLQTLDLNGNQLEGKVPKSLDNCTKLKVLDLGNNQMSDTFPCWSENISSLRVLILRSNKFYGNIGCPGNNGYWPLLQIVDLSFNNFFGSIPRDLLKAWEAMMVDEAESDLKHLQFESHHPFISHRYQDTIALTIKGSEMELVKILTVYTSVDLSNNNFQGPIPEEIGLFKSLHFLNLSNNALTGLIPSSIGNLSQLESLDLSKNNLTGAIPASLASLHFLSFLNVSCNHLEGRIPSSTQLQSFPSASFEGNKRLCGPPLTNNCTNFSALVPPTSASSNESNEIDWQFIIAMGVGFIISYGVVVTPLFFSKKVNEWYDGLINKCKVKLGM